MYGPGELYKVLPYIMEYNNRVGVEVFPLFDDAGYKAELDSCLDELKRGAVTFHGPYYGAEHSAAKGTAEYDRTMDMVMTTLDYCRRLNARYFVFHHNNCVVRPEKKREMLETSHENFLLIRRLYAEYGIPAVLENAGVKDRGNMLMDQQEFIEECRSLGCNVLIDIGHAHANGWDLRKTIEALKNQIISYHIHNNDGQHDSHRRIFDGSLDFETFIADVKELTPKASLVLEYSREVSNDEAGIRDDIDWLMANC